MASKPRVKHRADIKITDSKGQVITAGWGGSGVREFSDCSYTGTSNIYFHIPVDKTVGKTETYTVTVEYLGEKKYKLTYKQREKALAKSQERTKRLKEEEAKKKLKQDELELILRRKRIMNQVELAFVKQVSGAVDFITCDQCNAVAAHLGLTHENPGSQVIDPDQITGAWCAGHHGFTHQGKFYPGTRPFKTKGSIACDRLEFFYDGLRQLSIKP